MVRERKQQWGVNVEGQKIYDLEKVRKGYELVDKWRGCL